MQSTPRGLLIVIMAGILAMVTLLVSPVAAEEPEPARTEEPEAARTEEPAEEPVLANSKKTAATVIVDSGTAKKPRSLADLAGGIDLATPQGEGSEAIVITNQNLKTMGEGAVISHGSNIGGSTKSGNDWFVPPSARGTAPTDEEIEAARRRVEQLETAAGAIDQAVEENKAVNLYTGGGPQYRAPGQSDPLRNQQEKTNQELADAKAQLAALEKAAAQAARSGAKPSNPAPSGGRQE